MFVLKFEWAVQVFIILPHFVLGWVVVGVCVGGGGDVRKVGASSLLRKGSSE